MDKWSEQIVFSYQGWELSIGQLVGVAAIVCIGTFLFIKLKKFIGGYSQKIGFGEAEAKKTSRRALIIFALFIVILLLVILKLDYQFIEKGGFSLTVSRIILAVIIILGAQLADLITALRIREQLARQEDNFILRDTLQPKSDMKNKGTHIVQFIIITLASYLLLQTFPIIDVTLLTMTVKSLPIKITISKVLIAILVVQIARLVIWFTTSFFFHRIYENRDIEFGKRYAYNQLYSYILYLIAVLFALQYLGINMTLLWTGAAALLVGIGIALQNSISDFFCGIVLLFEGSVKVGDFLELEQYSGKVLRIGLRSSIVETRANRTIIVPNSKLVNYHVVNWSNVDLVSRFSIEVGVAYGSDVELVKKVLIQAASEHPEVDRLPEPFVRFMNFGDSALQFSLFFFCKDFLRIEDIRSDIRFSINQKFIENNIRIPFPQRDVWMRDDGA